VSPALAVAIGAARLAPLAWVAPPLGGPARAARVIMALLATAMVAPLLFAQPDPSTPASALRLIAGELGVGLTLGLVASVPFAAARAAGALLDGATQPWRALVWPRRDAGPLADGYALFALALFAAFDGPRLVLAAAAQSYAALPPGRGLVATDLPALLGLGAKLVAAAVTLAAPALAALLVADVAFALLARAQPALARAAGAADAAPLRLLIVVLAVAASIYTATHALGRAFSDAAHLRLVP
jgi:flagellar biosynthesis protein FliR